MRRLPTQGQKIVTSTSNRRTPVVSENDVKIQETDDSQEETSTQINQFQSG